MIELIFIIYIISFIWCHRMDKLAGTEKSILKYVPILNTMALVLTYIIVTIQWTKEKIK